MAQLPRCRQLRSSIWSLLPPLCRRSLRRSTFPFVQVLGMLMTMMMGDGLELEQPQSEGLGAEGGGMVDQSQPTRAKPNQPVLFQTSMKRQTCTIPNRPNYFTWRFYF